MGWSTYVISLSQAGKRSPLNALGDAVKGVGEGDYAKLHGGQGLTLFNASIGSGYQTKENMHSHQPRLYIRSLSAFWASSMLRPTPLFARRTVEGAYAVFQGLVADWDILVDLIWSACTYRCPRCSGGSASGQVWWFATQINLSECSERFCALFYVRPLAARGTPVHGAIALKARKMQSE